MTRTYDLPLIDWISIGLRKDKLASVTKAIRDDREFEGVEVSRTNARYMEKILREEALKQFSDKRRPMLEVILNSIDARPLTSADDFDVRIKLGRSFKSEDNGAGMNVDDILKLLIIPFNTEKDGVSAIGRFGVGFLSTFNYCTRHPNKASVEVYTQKAGERYHLEFYATGGEVSSIRMKLEKTGLKKLDGTKVRICSPFISKGIGRFRRNKRECLDYFSNHIAGIPPYVARIFLNGDQINKEGDCKWYTSDVELKRGEQSITQKVGIRVEENLEKPFRISLTSQGVLVKSFSSEIGPVTISFPSAVQVVEGRDEFKLDDNYRACVRKTFASYMEFVKERQLVPSFVGRAASFIPDLASAFEIRDIRELPNLDEIRDILLRGKTYVLTWAQESNLEPFFGETVFEKSFSSSHTGVAYWNAVYSGMDDFLKNEIKIVKSHKTVGDFFSLSEREYPNLARTVRYALPSVDYGGTDKEGRYIPIRARSASADGHVDVVHLVNIPVNGRKAFYQSTSDSIVRTQALYVNLNHPLVSGPFSYTKSYGLLAEYLSSSEFIKRNGCDHAWAENLLLREVDKFKPRPKEIVLEGAYNGKQ